MRHSQEGKASLERYRLASARIFSEIGQTLRANVGKNRFILERASIDEIFLDVTDHAYSSVSAWGGNSTDSAELNSLTEAAQKETVVFGNANRPDSASGDDHTDEDARAIRRGCIVAKGVRNAVRDALGFTMSAGISINKTVAKLGTSYGKPNGQAVVQPQYVSHLMEQTPIRKCRNMGGKVGKKIQEALLSEDEDKMGSIARLLSLNELVGVLGSDTGRRVFDVARGIDHEPVEETKGTLTKSITAFKSFSATDFDGLVRWIELLGTDVEDRVEKDFVRNQRYPRSCTVHYYFLDSRNDRIGRSARIQFPGVGDRRLRVNALISKVGETLRKKNCFPINRLGLAAIDFEERTRHGAIDGFFAKQASPAKSREAGRGDEEGRARQATASASDLSSLPAPDSHITDEVPHNSDLKYAEKLQASYDKEASLLSALDRSRNRSKAGGGNSKKSGSSANKRHSSGTNKIDSFFSKK